ncbi:MAG: hypothetical protein ACYS0I_10540 [Planctomycetota bacterium]|jgi:hypothetical protein
MPGKVNLFVGLVPLARSWNHPAELKVLEGNVKSKGYDKFQRAYVLECEDGACNVELSVSGSEDSAIVNPAFVINSWGDANVKLEIDDKKVKRRKNFHFGYRHRLEGTDLIVWIKVESTKPIKILLSPVE